MVLRSPHCSDRARVHLLSVSCKTCVFPWPVPGVRTPFPRPDVNMSPLTGVASAWDSHPHGRRCITLKWDGPMLAEPLRFHGLSSPAAGSAARGPRNGGGGAKAALRTGSHVCPQVTPSRPSGHHSPLPENMLTSHKHPGGRPKTKQKQTK